MLDRGRPFSRHRRSRLRIFANPIRVSAIAGAALFSLGVGLSGCRRPQAKVGDDGGIDGGRKEDMTAAPAKPPPIDGPKLGAIALQVNIYSRPDGTSKRIGY